jgi:hypothetical protein
MRTPGFGAAAALYRSSGYGPGTLPSARGSEGTVSPAFWREVGQVLNKIAGAANCEIGCWVVGGTAGSFCEGAGLPGVLCDSVSATAVRKCTAGCG